MRLGLVWAEARGRVIGRDGGMPWSVPEDLAHFREVTLGAPVIMGRRTWESFPERFRPLPGRRNIVVTGSDSWQADGAERAGSLDAALDLVREVPAAWVIGGARLFAEAIGRADVLEVTELDLEVDGDTFAPERPGWNVARIEPQEGWSVSRTGVPYRFLTLVRG
ncbi:MAG: dihydrofolate reductase [Microbacterium sp. SCN 70-27]|uniref:dihydrofolate reductase n=1 Tax=unclassified Microbacterium TaxID=2609290 RepID=UPI00086E70E4|nr:MULTISPECIES: dihydrofolate reductase [unclassified Microbacterium]MBN9224827.1 dihydrofolate reductase [Microbacterium sp.]ODT27755.1 MAG: dihydrofolate reductase [Microbacterium sp. SCN 70-27]